MYEQIEQIRKEGVRNVLIASAAALVLLCILPFFWLDDAIPVLMIGFFVSVVVIAIIAERAKKFGLETEVIYTDAPCPVVDYKQAPFKRLEEAAAEVYPGVGICPYVMTGGTDAKYYKEVSDHCLRFAPLYIDDQQYGSIHGLNENIYQGTLPYGVDFYKSVIKQMEHMEA